MRPRTIVVLLTLTTVAVTTVARARDLPSPTDVVVERYRSGLARLDSALVQLDVALADTNPVASQRRFREARDAFKRVEAFVEYFGHFSARAVNGAPLPRVEEEDPDTPLPPAGLQVVEADVFPMLHADRVAAARREITFIRLAVRQLGTAGLDTMSSAAFVFDAWRHEIARVSTLGVAGFDVTTSGDAMLEGASALDGVHDAMEPFRRSAKARDRALWDTLDARFAGASVFLRTHPDFEEFDRLRFIASYVQPLSRAFDAVQKSLDIPAPPRPRAWSARSASVYDAHAFDAMFFASLDARDARPASPELLALGRELFFDPALSGPGDRSCATCHIPERAFTDGRPRPMLLPGHVARGGGRNTPTLVNAALQPTLFADGRDRTLEDQATDVIGSPGEMGGSLAAATVTLRQQRRYVERFGTVFGGTGDAALTPRNVRLAIAAYVRSLTAMDSRFDRAARGDTAAVTDQERRGFNLFMGKARCGTCHFAPLFNGASPPMYLESEPEVIGVPATNVTRGAVVDPDSGVFNILRADMLLHAFKTPTLRNIELTAPYMHNGVFSTLDDVVRFYDAGGGHGVGIRVTQTLPTDSLHLSAGERAAIIAFMRSLTDTSGLGDRAKRPTAR